MAEADDGISVPGLPEQLSLIAFGGDASWTGYQLITGHSYLGNGQAVVNTGFLTDTGTQVGDSYQITSGSRHITVRITGEIFEPNGGTPKILASLPTLSGLDPQLSAVQYDVALRPGTAAASYANALATALGPSYSVSANTATPSEFAAVIGLIAALTLLLAAVAGLGVLNTVVLQTRERVHDLGAFKAVGMTPRQVTAMVVCSVAGIGRWPAWSAIPAGITLQRYVLPVMAHAAQTGVPWPWCSTCTHPASSSCSRCPAWFLAAGSRWRRRQRRVHVPVQVEGEEDDGRGAAAPERIRRVASRPSISGIRTSIRTTFRAGPPGRVHRLGAVRGVGDDVDAVGGENHPETGPYQRLVVGDHDPKGAPSRASPQRYLGHHVVAAGWAPTGREGAAIDGEPLPQTGQPAAAPVAGPRASRRCR